MLLVALGIAADRATENFSESTQWVSHTREVETNVEKIRADLYAAESGRLGYVLSGTSKHKARYESAKAEILQQLEKLKSLTRDNRREQERLNALDPVVASRIALLDESLSLRQSGEPDRERQDQITVIGLEKSGEAMALLDQMKEEEGHLLAHRSSISEQTYGRTRMVLGLAFAAVILLLFANFWQLLRELRDRKRAEASVRRLSGRILQSGPRPVGSCWQKFCECFVTAEVRFLSGISKCRVSPLRSPVGSKFEMTGSFLGFALFGEWSSVTFS
jgi:CHASE3 domain sensor protein